MRIAISNLAWDVTEDSLIADLLALHGIDAIDVAPGKYFPDLTAATADEIERVREWWSARGIAITGMQALLFGTSGLNMFGDDASRSAMLTHLDAVCRVGAGLGGSRLVFGSPRNRDRSALDDGQALTMAVDFFRRLGDIAARHDVLLCLEPNPPCYGANFMTDSKETALIVTAVDHPAIRMQLDTGAIAINGEDPLEVVENWGGLIGHVHASEPDLAVLGDGSADHGRTAAALTRHLPGAVVTIEMLPPKDEPRLPAIERALQVALRHYRGTGEPA